MSDILTFLLVPDGAAARRVRRELASRGSRCGVVAGTWGELVEQACRAYVTVRPASEWEERLSRAARELSGAFWSGSLAADPEGTLCALGRDLRRLVEALGPGGEIRPGAAAALSARGKRNLSDLARLHEAMGRALPADLAAIRALLDADAADATRRIAVVRRDGLPRLSPWQAALLDRIGRDSGAAPDPELAALLGDVLDPAPRGAAGSVLRHLQDRLFAQRPSEVPPDDSVTFLEVRDYLEAVEVAAGMAQRALADDPSLSSGEIALLLPGDGSCDAAAGEVFRRAGLPLSGLPGPPRLRNLGGETVFHFLVTRRRPAPAMALAALYSSVLMPWDESTGNRLAMRVMEREYDPEPPEGLSAQGLRMTALLRERHDTAAALAPALAEFASLLDPGGRWDRHVEVARRALAAVADRLAKAGGGEIPWEDLAALVPQAPLQEEGGTEHTREGIAVFREDEEPWRPVRRLFVLGFSEGRFPAGPARSPVFDAADERALKGECGYVLETAQEAMDRRRTLFLRQLRVVSERAVFLSPRRDPMGERLAVSGTAAFVARLIEGCRAPEDLFLTLEREAHRKRVRGLAAAPPAVPEPAAAVPVRDPGFGCDLLADDAGSIRPLTASGLETLMVSPMAWLFERWRIKPLEWAPEKLDPALKGTLAHKVFEKLFTPGRPVPGAGEVRSSAGKLLDEAIRRLAPFLAAPEWYVERRNLRRDVETAAVRWRELLERSGARILGVETSLRGTFEGVPIRGRADLILSLGPRRLLVVDYKKSASSSRRTAMEEGYDIQASLYRRMLRAGAVEEEGGKGLADVLRDGAEIGVLYYMMDDQRALSDTSGWIPRNVSGVQELGDGISAVGEELVRERIRALRAGTLPLNSMDDKERFEKAGVKTYALEASPLITRFAHPAAVEDDDE